MNAYKFGVVQTIGIRPEFLPLTAFSRRLRFTFTDVKGGGGIHVKNHYNNIRKAK